MKLRRAFVRKAMGLEIELEITPDELAQLWRDHEQLGIERVAYDEKDQPGQADVEVDGDSEDTDWDEPAADWMDEKKAAVRRVMACLMNDAASLPGVGRSVDRIVRRVGTVDIYFDDGSFVSAQVEDPQPQTGGVVPKKPGGCGCRQASCEHVAAPEVDLVAAVRGGELLGAVDARKRGADDLRYWRLKVEPPFDLHHLSGVPMAVAVPLTDIGTRSARIRDGRQGWRMARKFAPGRPFKRLR